METKAFEAPALYGDHHVSEVQSILKELPGIDEVYASSGGNWCVSTSPYGVGDLGTPGAANDTCP